MWLAKGLVLAAWLAFILIFLDAVDPVFDIRTALLNVLAVVVVAGMGVAVIVAFRR